MTKPKRKKWRLVAAAGVIILTLVAVVYQYTGDYTLRDNIIVFENAIKELGPEGANRPYRVPEANILEVIDLGREKIVFFEGDENLRIFGFAFFERGANMRYRISGYRIWPMPYPSFVTVQHGYPDMDRLFIAGYNCGGIHSYGIRLEETDYIQVGEEWHRNVLAEAILPVESDQFFFIMQMNEFYEYAGINSEYMEDYSEKLRWPYYVVPSEPALYDEFGNNITGDYFLPDVRADWSSSSSMSKNVNFWPVVVFLLALGSLCVWFLLRRPNESNQK
jgi:hypothetical protein